MRQDERLRIKDFLQRSSTVRCIRYASVQRECEELCRIAGIGNVFIYVYFMSFALCFPCGVKYNDIIILAVGAVVRDKHIGPHISDIEIVDRIIDGHVAVIGMGSKSPAEEFVAETRTGGRQRVAVFNK